MKKIKKILVVLFTLILLFNSIQINTTYANPITGKVIQLASKQSQKVFGSLALKGGVTTTVKGSTTKVTKANIKTLSKDGKIVTSDKWLTANQTKPRTTVLNGKFLKYTLGGAAALGITTAMVTATEDLQSNTDSEGNVNLGYNGLYGNVDPSKQNVVGTEYWNMQLITAESPYDSTSSLQIAGQYYSGTLTWFNSTTMSWETQSISYNFTDYKTSMPYVNWENGLWYIDVQPMTSVLYSDGHIEVTNHPLQTIYLTGFDYNGLQSTSPVEVSEPLPAEQILVDPNKQINIEEDAEGNIEIYIPNIEDPTRALELLEANPNMMVDPSPYENLILESEIDPDPDIESDPLSDPAEEPTGSGGDGTNPFKPNNIWKPWLWILPFLDLLRACIEYVMRLATFVLTLPLIPSKPIPYYDETFTWYRNLTISGINVYSIVMLMVNTILGFAVFKYIKMMLNR